MAEQRSYTGGFDNRWLFTGKELDESTGLYYFGARFYNPSTSIWLSVDPLAEIFPSISPYNYVLNNPISTIDPDGRGPIRLLGNLLQRGWNGIRSIIPRSWRKCGCVFTTKTTLRDAWLLKDINIKEKTKTKVMTLYFDYDIDFGQNSVEISSNEANIEKINDLAGNLKKHKVITLTLIGNSDAEGKNEDEVSIDNRNSTVGELKRGRAEAVKKALIKKRVKSKNIEIVVGNKKTKSTRIKALVRKKRNQ